MARAGTAGGRETKCKGGGERDWWWCPAAKVRGHDALSASPDTFAARRGRVLAACGGGVATAPPATSPARRPGCAATCSTGTTGAASRPTPIRPATPAWRITSRRLAHELSWHRRRALELHPGQRQLQPLLRRGPRHGLRPVGERPRGRAAAEDPLRGAALARRCGRAAARRRDQGHRRRGRQHADQQRLRRAQPRTGRPADHAGHRACRPAARHTGGGRIRADAGAGFGDAARRRRVTCC